MSIDLPPAVLVVGAYFSDRPTRVLAIASELAAARKWRVEQAWAALGGEPLEEMRTHTAFAVRELVPKFVLMNRLIAERQLANFRYLFVVDDDISLPPGFVDAYLEIVARRGYVLSQPARDHRSYTDHYFVNQLLGVESRETRYVEVGPLFVVESRAFPVLLPFEEAAPMGWGYDYVWPVRLHDHGMPMGIIDACPVLHDLRKPVSYYSHAAAADAMRAYLDARPHLPASAAFRIVQSYPLEGAA